MPAGKPGAGQGEAHTFASLERRAMHFLAPGVDPVRAPGSAYVLGPYGALAATIYFSSADSNHVGAFARDWRRYRPHDLQFILRYDGRRAMLADRRLTPAERQALEEFSSAVRAMLGPELRGMLDAAQLPYLAASRAYYAVFHAARALLFSAGIETRTHRGVASMVGEHFVKPGVLDSGLGRLLSRMQRDREDADYLAGAVFTEVDVREMLATAETFLSGVERILKAVSPGSRSIRQRRRSATDAAAVRGQPLELRCLPHEG